MPERSIIAPASAVGVRLNRGDELRIIDLEGGQSGDLLACSPDGRDRFSSGRTFDYGGTLYPTTGDVLWSDLSEPMLTIVADDVGRHDLLYANCSVEMFRIQYKQPAHPNCRDNLSAALRGLGIDPLFLPPAFNFFMNVDVVEGKLVINKPRSRAGDSMVVRAEMDLAIALSSCPASLCNGPGAPRPIGYEIRKRPA